MAVLRLLAILLHEVAPDEQSEEDIRRGLKIAKAVGALSLIFWFGVLSYGRLLPYLGTGGG